MPKNIRRSQVAIKVQATPGTFDTGVYNATYAGIRILEGTLKFKWVSPEFERNVVSDSIESLPSIMTTAKMTLEFEAELKGGGTPGDSNALDHALKACGYEATIALGTAVAYTPISTAIPVASIAFYQDGRRFSMRDAAGEMGIEGTNGEPCRIVFSFTGVPASIEDAALLSSPAYDPTAPPALRGAPLTFFGSSSCTKSFSFKKGNTVAERECFGSYYGHEGFTINESKTTMSIDPEAQAISTFHPWYHLYNGALGAFSLTIGSTAGNIITIASDYAQVVGVDEEDRNKILIDKLDLRFVSNEAGTQTSHYIRFS